jgi:PRC-barrel domain protein
VVDPVAKSMTHLVVEPAHRVGLGRLVPLKLATEAASDVVTLACTIAEFEQLESAESTEFVPGSRGYASYGPEQILSWPYYPLGESVTPFDDAGKFSETATYDAVPAGEVAVRRGAPVHATDGAIGHVQGLVIDPATGKVTHVLLAEGHLWGRKQVAIPISSVSDMAAEIKLTITKHEVAALPPVPIAA